MALTPEQYRIIYGVDMPKTQAQTDVENYISANKDITPEYSSYLRGLANSPATAGLAQIYTNQPLAQGQSAFNSYVPGSTSFNVAPSWMPGSSAVNAEVDNRIVPAMQHNQDLAQDPQTIETIANLLMLVGASGATGLWGAGSAAGASGGAAAGTGTAAGTTAGTAAGSTAGTGLTAGQVATGATAGAGMLGGSGSGSGGSSTGTSTGTTNMTTTNPVTGAPQQSGTGTFGGTTSTGTTSNAGFWNSAGDWVTSPSGIGTIANLGAGYLQGQSSQAAAESQGAAQIEAARIAAENARFRPVGVTTGFGASQFGYDREGRLISAGYQLTPEMQRQQDQLLRQSGGMLRQATRAQQATRPMGQAAQSMFTLGQGYLGTSPQEQAAKYMAEQQALLSTGRERDLASLQNRLVQQGRSGLATGGTGMMGAANPEMEAFYNAQRQQDLGLAAQATQGGMDYAKFGAGMVGMGGTTLQDMYRTQTAAYDPYNASLQGASNIEQLGQGAMNIGTSIGQQVSTAGTNQGNFLTGGQQNAANYQTAAQSYNPYASMLGGVGQSMNQYSNQNQWSY